MKIAAGTRCSFRTKDGLLEIESVIRGSVFVKDIRTNDRYILPEEIFNEICVIYEKTTREWTLWYNKDFNQFSTIAPDGPMAEALEWEQITIREVK